MTKERARKAGQQFSGADELKKALLSLSVLKRHHFIFLVPFSFAADLKVIDAARTRSNSKEASRSVKPKIIVSYVSRKS